MLVTLKFVPVAQTIHLSHKLLNPADNANLTSPFAPAPMRHTNHNVAAAISDSLFLP